MPLLQTLDPGIGQLHRRDHSVAHRCYCSENNRKNRMPANGSITAIPAHFLSVYKSTGLIRSIGNRANVGRQRGYVALEKSVSQVASEAICSTPDHRG